ncbi:MAG: TerB family tellurite resistance protein [Hyphomicrobiaceae bacterium]
MLKHFKSLIDDVLGDQKPTGLSAEEVQIACAALLVHCANADGHRSDVEDSKLRAVLADRYSLPPEDVGALIDDAEQRVADAGDLHKFTWVLHQNLDRDGRLEVVRLLWEISHADDNIDHDERAAVNLVASMLDVELADAVALRRRVEKRD